MLRSVRIPPLLISLFALAALACSDSGGDAAAPASTAVETASAASTNDTPAPAKKKSKAKRKDKPLPAFSGFTMSGERLSVTSLIGRRLLLFFFNPEVKDAPIAAGAVGRIAELRSKQNFEIVGVATGSKHDTIREFMTEHKIDYRVIDDSSAEVANRLGLRQPMALLGVDAEGYVIFGVPASAGGDANAGAAIEAQLRDSLRLAPLETANAPTLGHRPDAPNFSGRILGEDATFELAAHRGEAVIAIFFLHTCPHCHETLEFFKEALAEMPEDKRPLLVGIEVTGKTGAVRESMREMELDFFPVLFDDDGSKREAYGVFAGVPDTFFIDAQGRIAARVKGWRPAEDEHLAKMRMAKLSGAPIPMLLRKTGFSGSDACGVCHELEHETWLFTKHAGAFDTLVRHGSATDEECVSCHVVGFGKDGGFESPATTPALENVGCENCHGRGGPHLSPNFVQGGDYSTACATCHNPEHSLGFEYASFRPKISHAANAHVVNLSVEERRKLLIEIGAPRDVLPSNADYVGSDACRSCHESEFDTWSKSPHAHAAQTIADAGKSDDTSCLKCHTTAFGRPGGFPNDAVLGASADLERVGCESCHGPGGNHVAEDAATFGTIVSLGDKCDSCVILQICGACHDDANDPGFEFEVLDKIEAQRHGTTEPGTSDPKSESAALADPLRVAHTHAHSRPDAHRAAARAFELLRSTR
jgi:peroxiredoxin